MQRLILLANCKARFVRVLACLIYNLANRLNIISCIVVVTIKSRWYNARGLGREPNSKTSGLLKGEKDDRFQISGLCMYPY